MRYGIISAGLRSVEHKIYCVITVYLFITSGFCPSVTIMKARRPAVVSCPSKQKRHYQSSLINTFTMFPN